MTKINWTRLFIGGLIAAIICFLTDGLLHEQLLGADWKSVYDHLGIANPPGDHGAAVFYFAVFELGRGFITVFLYALMRAWMRPGPKTAVIAGIVAWIAFSVTGPAQFIPLGFYSSSLWIKAGVFQLVTSVVAAIAGAAVYKD